MYSKPKNRSTNPWYFKSNQQNVLIEPWCLRKEWAIMQDIYKKNPKVFGLRPSLTEMQGIQILPTWIHHSKRGT